MAVFDLLVEYGRPRWWGGVGRDQKVPAGGDVSDGIAEDSLSLQFDGGVQKAGGDQIELLVESKLGDICCAEVCPFCGNSGFAGSLGGPLDCGG